MYHDDVPRQANGLILVTGATGYVGGRLVPRLLELSKAVRVLVRDPKHLEAYPWAHQVQVAKGDALQRGTLNHAMSGVHTAYYLIHSMAVSEDFQEFDEAAAWNFGDIANKAGIKRIIYLGGLADPHAELSRHMRSRQLVGNILRQSGVPVIEFRASMIIGSGSAAFEMIRYLTEGLPILICPRSVLNCGQPIGIRDVLAYLLAASRLEGQDDHIIEIGGADVLTYSQVLKTYARIRGHRRRILPLLLMQPRTCARWVKILTPIPDKLALPLIESLHSESVVSNPLAKELFPQIEPEGVEVTFRRALLKLETGTVETTWRNALVAGGMPETSFGHITREGIIVQRVAQKIQASRLACYAALKRFGKPDGWRFDRMRWGVHASSAPNSKSFLDNNDLTVGDTVDSWRVETIHPERLICFTADLKLPGRVWAEFEIQDKGTDSTHLLATAYFTPRGLPGLLYWYLLYPLRTHGLKRMLRKLAQLAQTEAQEAIA